MHVVVAGSCCSLLLCGCVFFVVVFGPVCAVRRLSLAVIRCSLSVVVRCLLLVVWYVMCCLSPCLLSALFSVFVAVVRCVLRLRVVYWCLLCVGCCCVLLNVGFLSCVV